MLFFFLPLIYTDNFCLGVNIFSFWVESNVLSKWTGETEGSFNNLVVVRAGSFVERKAANTHSLPFLIIPKVIPLVSSFSYNRNSRGGDSVSNRRAFHFRPLLIIHNHYRTVHRKITKQYKQCPVITYLSVYLQTNFS